MNFPQFVFEEAITFLSSDALKVFRLVCHSADKLTGVVKSHRKQDEEMKRGGGRRRRNSSLSVSNSYCQLLPTPRSVCPKQHEDLRVALKDMHCGALAVSWFTHITELGLVEATANTSTTATQDGSDPSAPSSAPTPPRLVPASNYDTLTVPDTEGYNISDIEVRWGASIKHCWLTHLTMQERTRDSDNNSGSSSSSSSLSSHLQYIAKHCSTEVIEWKFRHAHITETATVGLSSEGAMGVAFGVGVLAPGRRMPIPTTTATTASSSSSSPPLANGFNGGCSVEVCTLVFVRQHISSISYLRCLAFTFSPSPPSSPPKTHFFWSLHLDVDRVDVMEFLPTDEFVVASHPAIFRNVVKLAEGCVASNGNPDTHCENTNNDDDDDDKKKSKTPQLVDIEGEISRNLVTPWEPCLPVVPLPLAVQQPQPTKDERGLDLLTLLWATACQNDKTLFLKSVQDKIFDPFTLLIQEAVSSTPLYTFRGVIHVLTTPKGLWEYETPMVKLTRTDPALVWKHRSERQALTLQRYWERGLKDLFAVFPVGSVVFSSGEQENDAK